jgi:hypothetical protein
MSIFSVTGIGFGAAGASGAVSAETAGGVVEGVCTGADGTDCAVLAGVVFDVSASVPAALLILDIGSGSVAAA